MNPTQIAVAVIGAVTAITGAFFTASATADTKVNDLDKKVEVLTERQLLQYSEVKEDLQDVKAGVERIEDYIKN